MKHPIPFYTPQSLEVLNSLIQPHWKVLEYGSGHSTIWYAERVNKVVSVEHNQTWYNIISKEAAKKNLVNLDYKLVDRPYNHICNQFEDEYFDLVIVDGRDRNKCVQSSIPKVKSKGYLILDNSDRTERYKHSIDLLADWNHTIYPEPSPADYGVTDAPIWWTTIYQKP